MASGISNYLAGKYLNRTFGATAYSDPTTLYIALYTAAPSDSAAGTEVSGGSYARQSVACNTTNWPAASSGTITLSGATVTFPTASANWGTVTDMSFMDASTVGNLMYWGDLTASQVINNGNTAQFNASAISVSLA